MVSQNEKGLSLYQATARRTLLWEAWMTCAQNPTVRMN